MARRGFGDEAWRLALAGEAEALERAADLLDHDPAERDYDTHRLRAFALAIGGRREDALAELNEGWTDEWPFPSAYATDVARVRYLAGDYEEALGALRLAVSGAERLDPGVSDLARECVRRSPGLWGSALRVVLAGGKPSERAGAGWGGRRARFA